jgi:CDGSH-type Zn-finger protein
MGTPRIRVVRDGPMLVEGLALTRLVKDAAGVQSTELVEPQPAEPYALCRCGRSGSLPLCDRQPPYGCFNEEAQGGGPEPKPFRWNVPDPARPGLALKPNGPVRVAGGVPIVAEGAAPLMEDRISLCRCGASRSQPVCDGSHKIVGYREPPEPGSGPSPEA